MIRFLVKFVVYTLLLAIVGIAAAVFFLVEERPLVAQATAPNASDVHQARAFVQGVRDAAAAGEDESSDFVTTTRQMNSVIRLGGRVLPGYRGVVLTEGNALLAQVSVPVPWIDGSRWLNLSAAIPPFQDGFALESLEVGGVGLPPAPVLAVARQSANLFAGNGIGDTLLGAAESMRIDESRVTFSMAMGDIGSNGLLTGLLGGLRGNDMPSPEEVTRYYAMIRDAMDAGTLPLRGSYLPYVTFTLEAARQGAAEEGADNAYTSALIGLSLVCGARDFNMLIGGVTLADLTEKGRWRTRCDALTLNGRVDSRLHFTTAATIQAVSNRGLSVSMGEFKELFDSAGGGSGFDFTDIAANNSGIRMSNKMMAAPVETWPDLIARIETERDVIISFDGMQRGITEREFVAKYGEVDSPAYLQELATIEAKIDALALHQ